MQSSSQNVATNKPTLGFFYRPDALPVAQPIVVALKGKYLEHSNAKHSMPDEWTVVVH